MRAPIEYVAHPATSFPFRDVLVLEQLDLRPHDDVCEIGVGSGATTARLSRLCASVTGVDVSSIAIDALAYLERRRDNLHLRVGDATKPETFAAVEGAFTRVVSCDTLEHVADPAAYFAAIARCLAAGGRFLVTFPNEPRARMHGVTRFDSAAELRDLATRAGLVDVRLGAVRLSPYAARVAERLGFKPLRAVRDLLRVRGGAAAPSTPPPQTFDQTAFHARASLWRPIAPVVNLYWWAVLRLMAREGTCFRVDWDFTSTDFHDAQILVTGARPTAMEEAILAEVRAVGAAARRLFPRGMRAARASRASSPPKSGPVLPS